MGTPSPSWKSKKRFLNHLIILCPRSQGKTGFKLLPALKGVLTTLTKPEMINVVWTENYSKEHVDRSLLVDFPLVLDPANPTNNVAKFSAPHVWNQLKTAAREALEETILKR